MLSFTAGHQAQRLAVDFGRLAAGIRTGTNDLLERVVNEIARPRFQENFQTAGGSDPWEELSDETVERRNRPSGAGGDRPLVASGAGRLAVTGRERWTVTRDQAVYVGTDWGAPYMQWHQGGTDHVPARPWARLEQQDMEALDEVGLTWLDGIIPWGGF